MRLKIRVSSRNERFKRVTQYLLLVMLVTTHNPWFYALNDMNFRVFNIIISALFMLLVPRTRGKNLVPIFIFILIPTIVLELIFSGMSQISEAIYNYMFIIEPIMLTYVTYQYDKKYFCNRFIKVVIFMAIVSLGFYAIAQVDYKYLINSGMFHKVEINRLTYTNFYCNYLYVLRDREVSRNVGIFCEPGLYQILLNSAVYLLVFYPNESAIKYRKTAIAILIIALITTQSGTGFIGLTIIILGIVFSKRKQISKSIKQITIVALALLIFFGVADFAKNGVNSFLYIVLFEKILNIGSSDLTTGSVRLSTITTMLNLIVHNPIGYGFSYVSNYRFIYAPESVGARLFVSCAAVGVIPIFVLLHYYIKYSFKHRISNVQFVVLWLLYINTTLAQSREFYPAILVLMILSQTKDEVMIGDENSE